MEGNEVAGAEAKKAVKGLQLLRTADLSLRTSGKRYRQIQQHSSDSITTHQIKFGLPSDSESK